MDMKKKQKKSDSPAIKPSFFKTRIDCAKVGLHTPASECPEPGCLGKQCWWLCQSRAQPTWPCLNDRRCVFFDCWTQKKEKKIIIYLIHFIYVYISDMCLPTFCPRSPLQTRNIERARTIRSRTKQLLSSEDWTKCV